MPTKQLSDNNPDGTVLGQSTSDLIGFYGATPVDKPDGAAVVTATIVSAQSAQISNTIWGFASQAGMSAHLALVTTIRAALVELGLMKSS
jgi:hypothetical protein